MNAVFARESRCANPWIWLGAGLLLCLLAASLSFAGPNATAVAASAVVLGLLCVGIGLTIRLNSSAPAFAERFAAARPLLLLAMIAFQVAGALFVCWSLLAAFLGYDPLQPGRHDFMHPPPLRPGLAIILWLMIVPMSVVGAARTFNHLVRREEWTVPLESGALFMFAAGATLLGGFAVAGSAPTLTLFLSVATALLSALVPFAVLTRTFQRLIVSAAIAMHFLAIINATLAAPPAPWLLGQLWTRFSRPYLEFMYLNNAYHFYAPDPGPATYVWFRIFYQSNTIDPETNNPKLVGHWFKIPDVKPDGTHGYGVSLEYQRYLSLTENVIRSEGPPSFFEPTLNGKAKAARFFESRIVNSPEADSLQPELIGQTRPRFVMEVPFHPQIARDAQYQKPQLDAQRMYETYVRHVAKVPHPDHPEWPVKSVKVYRVTHNIPLWTFFARGQDPQDPLLYLPFYMGEYGPDGSLMDADEPLLYWLLPMFPHSPASDASVTSYAAKHAGDPMHEHDGVQRKWMEPKKEAKR
jgi:hypothetical protein